MRNNNWYCVGTGCDEVLGEVSGNELYLSSSVSGDLINSYGPNLMVKCPRCATRKVWYTADPITRSIYQLVEAISGGLATRTVKKLSEKTLPKTIEE